MKRPRLYGGVGSGSTRESPPRVRALGAVLVVLLALVPAAGPSGEAAAQDAFWGEQDVQLGDGVTCTLSGRPDETHLFHFFAVAGTRVEATLRAADGTDLAPALRLVRPGGTAVDTKRKLRRDAHKATLRDFPLPFSGWFAFEVRAKSGSGGYRLATRGKPVKKLVGVVRDAEGFQSYRFAAVGGSSLSLALKPSGGPARPRILGIDDPSGAPLTFSTTDSGRTSKLDSFPLAADGTYVLRFRNEGPRGKVRLEFVFEPPVVANTERILPSAAGRPGSVVDAGAPALAARAGYVGSGACGRCHDSHFRDWAATAHNLGVRTWDRPGLTGKAFVNDLDGDGTDDFREGLDLATVPAFAAYGADAPKLSYVAGDAYPYKVRIGTVTYDVHRTMGGNGLWKQRFLTRAGRSYYVLPVQFNDVARAYAAYEAADWYDAQDRARYTDPSQIPKDRSFEANCSGCHNTGETIEVAAGGEFVTGHADFNIGCEQCHGPGAEHAETGDVSKITNPRNLIDGTAEGIAAADAVCARCHTSGTAFDAFPGTAKRAGFGYRADRGVQHLGDAQAEFLAATTDPADFWGRKTNPFPALPGDTYVASRSDQQQSLDIGTGRHAPEVLYAATCFACHDPHRRAQKHQIATSVDRGTRVVSAADDNSLCLGCHAGVPGPFSGVSKDDAALIASGTTPYPVVAAVVAHMADRAAMPVAIALHDPKGTGVGRCTTCHMVGTARAAVSTTDAAGYEAGDLHSHTFAALWPRASVLHGVTNSCNVCHPTRAGDPVATILADWATDGDGDGTFHADTPGSDQGGTANPGGAGGGQPCAACHTSPGFVRIQVHGESPSQSEIDEIVKESIAREAGVACDSCHGARADGTFATGPNPLRMEKGALCGSCHNARTVVFEDFLLRGEVVNHPTREMLDGTAGAEVPGSGTYSNSFHSNAGEFRDGCVVCHYDVSRSGASHRFAAQVSTCGKCHTGLDTFNRPSLGDWDGDGATEGVQDEVAGLLAAVEAALLLDPRIGFSGGWFEIDGASDHALTGASEAQKRAAYNWYSVTFDGSLGVHNAVRSVQLLQRSYRELTGADVPGADLR